MEGVEVVFAGIFFKVYLGGPHYYHWTVLVVSAVAVDVSLLQDLLALPVRHCQYLVLVPLVVQSDLLVHF